MHRLTVRRQNVTVMTVNALRTHLPSLNSATSSFSIDKVQRDRVSIRCDYQLLGKKKHSHVTLPAYPTGSPEDAPSSNLNVVLDPLSFENVESCAEREIFAPLLGHEVLEFYQRMHPESGLTVTRCC